MSIDLNSDSVVPGLQAMEVFRHGDVTLGNFYFPVNYPGVFTDLVPFHLAPQFLTNYDPNALRLAGFLIFVLIIAVYGAVVYKVSEDQVKALLFMALLGNLTPAAFYYFVQPTSHGATVLFAGVLLFFILDHDMLRLYQKALVAVFMFLMAFSDNLALAILALPFTLAIVYVRLRSNKANPVAALVPAAYLLLPALAGYAIKFLLPRMAAMSISTVAGDAGTGIALESLPDKILLFVTDTLSVFNDQLYAFASLKPGLFDIFGLALAIVLAYALWKILKTHKTDSAELKLFWLILLASNALLFLGYTLTSLSAARYLMFTSLSLFAAIALGYDKSKIYLALVAIVLLAGVIACTAAVI